MKILVPKRNIVQQCGVTYDKKDFSIVDMLAVVIIKKMMIRCHAKHESRKSKGIFNFDGGLLNH